MGGYAEIIMGGSGGQGLIFVSSFFAESAMQEGLHVAQTQSYGIAQRGGYISAEVIVSDKEILFQQVTKPNVIIALHDAVGTRFDDTLAPVVYDNELMQKKQNTLWKGLPFSRLAHEMGAPRAANLIAMGAALYFIPAISLEAVVAAARNKFAPAIAEININAVQLGVTEAAKAFVEKE